MGELIKNHNEKLKDLYYDKLQLIKTRISGNRYEKLELLFKLSRSIKYLEYICREMISNQSEQNQTVTRFEKRNSVFLNYYKPVNKILKLPPFSKTVFYSFDCIDTINKELEVST